jgi:hypothetical protein
MSEEWGPWVEHDGKGCPPGVVGQWVQCEGYVGGTRHIEVSEGQVVTSTHPAWSVILPWGPAIIRYRVRKPRALLDLIERARELDDAPQGPVRVPGKEVVG